MSQVEGSFASAFILCAFTSSSVSAETAESPCSIFFKFECAFDRLDFRADSEDLGRQNLKFSKKNIYVILPYCGFMSVFFWFLDFRGFVVGF